MYHKSDLHGYQRRAVDFILQRERCALWLDLGLGKTVVTLTALADWLDSFTAARVLVIAPLRVARSVWSQEAAGWSHTKHLRFSHILGDQGQRELAIAKRADIYVINRENVPWLVKRVKRRGWKWDTVVIDESSSFKDRTSKRFRAMRHVLDLVDRMVLLTGTPAANGLINLWAQMYLIDQGRALGKTLTSYRSRFFQSDYMGWKWEPIEGAQEKIHSLLQPMALSMASCDHLDVPPIIDVRVGLDLPGATMNQYCSFMRDCVLELSGHTIEASSAGVLAGKLLQFCQGAVYPQPGSPKWDHIHDVKLDALEEILEDNPSEPILVAFNFRSDLERLKKRFPFARRIDTDQSIADWNDGKIRMGLIHPASAGHGLNLQRGGAVLVWFGLTWDLELYQQTIGRLHRQGQTRPVRNVHLVVNGCFDERVMALLASKDAVQNSLLEALKKEVA